MFRALASLRSKAKETHCSVGVHPLISAIARLILHRFVRQPLRPDPELCHLHPFFILYRYASVRGLH